MRSELADGFVCLTRHLTIFAVVLEKVVLVLRCSTASDILSIEGFQNLFRSQWLSHLPCKRHFCSCRADVRCRSQLLEFDDPDFVSLLVSSQLLLEGKSAIMRVNSPLSS